MQEDYDFNGGTCANCREKVDVLIKVKGYLVCMDCEAQAYLPPHLRGDRGH